MTGIGVHFILFLEPVSSKIARLRFKFKIYGENSPYGIAILSLW
jgi:hypothetical protein